MDIWNLVSGPNVVNQSGYVKWNIAYRERLLQIWYRARKKSDNTEANHYGTGFLISPEGWAVTARHVLDPVFNDDEYEIVEYVAGGKPVVQIARAEGDGLVRLKLVQGTGGPSKKADIALFKVKTESTREFEKYMCLEFDDIRKDESTWATVAAWKFFDNRRYGWAFRFAPNVAITSDQGPGPLAEYWELSRRFEESMSGGLVARGGRVIGVIAESLERDERQLEGSNYAALVQYADDLNLKTHGERCHPQIPGEISKKIFQSQEAFMGTAQGTLAFTPGVDDEHWVFPQAGRYSLSRVDLPCNPGIGCVCSTGDDDNTDKSARFVINHRVDRASGKLCGRATLDSGEQTYYGVQVVPIFRNEFVDTTRQEAWLYRNTQLYERLRSGRFVITPGADRPISKRKGPVKFNEFISDIEELRIADSAGCDPKVDSKECLEIYRLEQAKKVLGPWHGFPRDKKGTPSTVADPEETWLIPEGWSRQNLQVKNWILRYRGTTERQTRDPVDFSFCIDPHWKEFYVRIFSPERCVVGQYIHVFLQD